MNIDLSEHWVMPASSKLIWVIAAVVWMFNTPIGGLILLGFLGLIMTLDDIQAKYFDMIEKNLVDFDEGDEPVITDGFGNRV